MQESLNKLAAGGFLLHPTLSQAVAQTALSVPARPEAVPLGRAADPGEPLAQQFDLWNKVRRLPGLAPRTRTSHGDSPERIVAPILYSFCSGGASRAEVERRNDEPLVRQLARVNQFADQTQLGQWLRAQRDASIAAVWKRIAEFIARGIARADAARWPCAGRAEVFFDDKPIEVHGLIFEGAKLNDDGDARCPGRRSVRAVPAGEGTGIARRRERGVVVLASAVTTVLEGPVRRFSGRQRVQPRGAVAGH